MAIKIKPREDQLKQLAILRDLEGPEIEKLIQALSAPDVSLIRPNELTDTIALSLSGRTIDTGAISRQLISLYTLCRQRNLSIDELLDGLSSGIQSSEHGWSESELKRWQEKTPTIKKLLSIDSIIIAVKALDLSYDYANLFQSAKILTDIRPIFGDDLEVRASVISFTIRMYYDDLEESKNISIALDEKDIKSLIKTCERALGKAEKAKQFMIASNIKKTFICGENNDTK
ncbi:MAG: hypothetical protein HGB26_05200 [Desulfobulbaceae bacterium]|nr:hypothetical protein [Desulfobulbaceae bacterium]